MSSEYYDGERNYSGESAANQDSFMHYRKMGYHRPGAAITSMILGICSVSLWFYPFITSIPCIIMGFVALRIASNEDGRIDPKYSGFLKAGRITGTIGVIVSILYTIIMVVLITSYI